MTTQGQRFRRRALRRGYKVDEVDGFLDRVEATLAGTPAGPPVGAQEVHDVVFRVRFGGYDEWQVDLHLDRVERQLAELEDRSGRLPAPDPMRDSMRGGLNAGGMGMRGMGGGMAPAAGRMAAPTERMPAAMRDDHPQPSQAPPRGAPANDPYGRYEGQTYGQPQPPQRPGPPAYEQGGYDQGGHDQGGYDQRGYDQGGYATGGYDPSGFDGFEAGRHGKVDMGPEMRPPARERDPRGGYGPAPMSGPPMSGPPMSGGAPMSGPPMGGQGQRAPMAAPSPDAGGEVHRIDQLRRTFQPRRFGSGYDPSQVDRLFESILQAMTGRGPMPVPENELDMLQFELVPGGYFEAEVDAALREVKAILLRRR